METNRIWYCNYYCHSQTKCRALFGCGTRTSNGKLGVRDATRKLATSCQASSNFTPYPLERIDVHVKLVGVSFDNRQQNIRLLQPSMPVFENRYRQQQQQQTKWTPAVVLMRDPMNQYDENAVECFTLLGKSIGFIPKALNTVLIDEMSEGMHCDLQL